MAGVDLFLGGNDLLITDHISELWVEAAFPTELSEASLGSLGSDGRIAKDLVSHLDQAGVFPSDRSLYQHQYEAILAAGTAQPTLRVTGLTIGGTAA